MLTTTTKTTANTHCPSQPPFEVGSLYVVKPGFQPRPPGSVVHTFRRHDGSPGYVMHTSIHVPGEHVKRGRTQNSKEGPSPCSADPARLKTKRRCGQGLVQGASAVWKPPHWPAPSAFHFGLSKSACSLNAIQMSPPPESVCRFLQPRGLAL